MKLTFMKLAQELRRNKICSLDSKVRICVFCSSLLFFDQFSFPFENLKKFFCLDLGETAEKLAEGA